MGGSVTELMKNRGYGFICREDGRLIYFDEKALWGSELRALSIGDWVEYEEQNGEKVSGPSMSRLFAGRVWKTLAEPGSERQKPAVIKETGE